MYTVGALPYAERSCDNMLNKKLYTLHSNPHLI